MKYVQQGVTLLEVIIALLILGIVSAVALPDLHPMLESDRASNSSPVPHPHPDNL